MHLFNRLWDRPVEDSGYLSWIHADPSFGYHITDESHFVFVELALLNLCVELVLTQDLKNGADVLGVEGRVFREDDDIVQDADGGKVDMLPQNIVHKMSEHGRCISKPLRAHTILIVPLPASKRSFPLIPFFYSNLMISIA